LTRYVLDASVAAKWFLPRAHETLVDEALALLSDYAADRISLMAPDLLWPEFANILWRRSNSVAFPLRLRMRR
jgi:predicted nucleic acid-binding protein